MAIKSNFGVPGFWGMKRQPYSTVSFLSKARVPTEGFDPFSFLIEEEPQETTLQNHNSIILT